MAKELTEDMVRDKARKILNLENRNGVVSGVGQLTTFNQLGFTGVSDKPDGWYLPDNKNDVAVVIETKASGVMLRDPQINEVRKNIAILQKKYRKTVGVLYNGEDTRVFKGDEEYTGPGANKLQNIEYYTSLYNSDHIDKEHIYELTARINNCLHKDFGIKNLYHRMIFTASALVAKRYGATMVEGMDYSEFHNAILNCLNKELYRDKQQNQKLGLMTEVFSEIKMNLNVESEDEKEQDHVKKLIGKFIGWVTEISECINSDAWRGEDVMGIFFNEFNRYKAKSEAGQVFTPEHITDFMYRILEVNQNDSVLDAACGSGGFLVKAMSNMIQEAGGVNTAKSKEIKSKQLYGIEFDREIYALACANMLIHKDGKTNLEHMDARTETAGEWIEKQHITKVMMNPPFENKYGCVPIVKNVLDHVPPHTLCGFILPEKKLEKVSKGLTESILKKHRILKIIKLPKDLFFKTGTSTSIFVFEAGVPQNNEEIFACWMKEDGLQTVKNKGRHDVHHKWPEIEKHWVEIVKKQSGDDTCQWIKPSEHLSYQVPQEPFRIYEEDFRKTAMDYVLYQKGVDTNELKTQLIDSLLYGRPEKKSGNEV